MTIGHRNKKFGGYLHLGVLKATQVQEQDLAPLVNPIPKSKG